MEDGKRKQQAKAAAAPGSKKKFARRKSRVWGLFTQRASVVLYNICSMHDTPSFFSMFYKSGQEGCDGNGKMFVSFGRVGWPAWTVVLDEGFFL